MNLKRLGIPKLITLLVALLMVVVGIILSRSTGGRDSVAAPQAAAPPAGAPAQPAQKPTSAPSPPSTPTPSRPTAAPGPTAAASAAAKPAAVAIAPRPSGAETPRKPALTRRATSTLPLPPLSPAGFGPAPAVDEAPPTGPAPSVLWLSGVIQGNPRVALLRRGENRYLVKEGGTFESYRMLKITSNSVTIQRGSRKQTLRVGQY